MVKRQYYRRDWHGRFASEGKTARINLRCRPEELNAWQDEAERMHMTLSEYLLAPARADVIRKRLEEADLEMATTRELAQRGGQERIKNGELFVYDSRRKGFVRYEAGKPVMVSVAEAEELRAARAELRRKESERS